VINNAGIREDYTASWGRRLTSQKAIEAQGIDIAEIN